MTSATHPRYINFKGKVTRVQYGNITDVRGDNVYITIGGRRKILMATSELIGVHGTKVGLSFAGKTRFRLRKGAEVCFVCEPGIRLFALHADILAAFDAA